MVSDYRTVSIPAISSALFGFPAKKCMMEAFLEYCASNTLSVICEIKVVVCNESSINAFTEEISKNLFTSSAYSAKSYANSRDQIRHTVLKSNLKTIFFVLNNRYPKYYNFTEEKSFHVSSF